MSHVLVAVVRDELAAAVKIDQLEELPVEEPKEVRVGKDGKTRVVGKKSNPVNDPDVPIDLLPSDLQRKVRNTAAASDPRQMARLAKLAKDDPQLALTVACMLHDCDAYTVDEALQESDQPEPEPQDEASAVLRQMLQKTKSVWRIQCPESASPSLGAAVLEAVADEWLNGGWF